MNFISTFVRIYHSTFKNIYEHLLIANLEIFDRRGGVVWGGMGRDFKIVHKLNGGSLGGWYSLLPATNFCSEWSVDRDQTTGGGP